MSVHVNAFKHGQHRNIWSESSAVERGLFLNLPPSGLQWPAPQHIIPHTAETFRGEVTNTVCILHWNGFISGSAKNIFILPPFLETWHKQCVYTA